MTLKALFYAYVLGGLTFLPLVIAGLIFFTIYTSVPVGDVDTTKELKEKMEAESAEEAESAPPEDTPPMTETQDMPRTRKGWLTMRRTFEESSADGGYVTLVRSFLDSRSKDPKRSRPKDMWYVVLKGKVLYLYEDEEMTECEAAIELGVYEVVVYPEGLLDGELFAKRNAICLKPKTPSSGKSTPTRTGDAGSDDQAKNGNKTGDADSEGQRQSTTHQDDEATMEGIFNPPPSWFIFVRSNVEMEDWYFSLIHAATQPSQTPTLAPLQAIFQPSDMGHLVSTLDEQPDVIPMRWLNALIGRIFFSYYRTHTLEAYIIGRLMKKLSKVKRPAFLTDIVVTEVSVGNKAPTLSKPMLKELTKEGDASVEVHLQYKGEVRITVEATATINLGARFKSYTVKLVLAAVLKELEGNLLIKVKRPPSNRLWYAFTQPPRMILEVEPIVSDRQITWGMILSTIESRLKEIIQESVVMPNMDDIAFFESTPYLHRGGIWSDASRHEKPPTPSPLTHSLADPILEDSQSTASAPLPTTQDVLPTPAEIPSRQAHSVDEIDAAPLFASPETSVNVPAGTPPSQEDSPSSTRANRRRTWFSSVKSEDMTSLIGLDVDGNRLSGDSERGRSAEPEKTSVPRSKSTPGAADSARGEYFAEPEEPSADRLSPHLARSPSSQHSQRRRSDAHASVPDSPMTQPTEPAASPSSTSLSPSSGSSFLSTLKSRAGDKQALSNTAKEAMRKWGVNWGNLRKDVSSSSAASDELPDDVSTGSRMRTDSTLAQKARASYAEVRAAVVERKGKGTSEDDERLSAPIPIPRRHSGRYSNASTSSVDEAPANSPERLLTPQKSGNLGTPGSPSPSISRVSTEVDGQTASTQENSTHTPIHVQPKAKTMTIPAIHASHRGDVMSMGYVPPQPTAPAPESLMKNPGIQSVYRLWKSPVLTGQAREQALQEAESSAEKEEIAPLVLSPPPPLPPRSAPPPLPPRSTPTMAISHPVDPPSQSSDEVPASALSTLKHISDLDMKSFEDPATSSSIIEQANGQSNDESMNLGNSMPPPSLKPSPPLPPRRIQTPA